MILSETFAFADGGATPKLGLGTWRIDDAAVEQVVREATAIGYRHFDTAQAHSNERGVGAGLRASGVPRDDLFVTTTRGRVSQAETERLAAELNMTPETLIARRKGRAFNAEGALAARQILAKSSNELVNAAKRITSGYRSQAYQAEMRRRGYRPANNSGHLDGSALDLLPPPGKTIAWLVERVRRAQPNARLLNEGDHLHATFPGYYGAPVLGGATKAGLKNPLAGMPPPPPGFKLD